MKKTKTVLRIIFFMVLFSNALGQEKLDAKGPILGGFLHDNTTRLIIIKYSQAKGYGDSFSFKLQNQNKAIIELYSFAGKWICNYIVNHGSIFFTFLLPNGIYFIKVREQIKSLYLIPGSEFKVALY